MKYPEFKTVMSAVVLSAALIISTWVTAASLIRKEAKSGEEIQVAALGSLNKQTCVGNARPSVKLSQPPAHGFVRMADATMKTNRFPNCPAAEIAVKVVFYKSQPDYTGTDLIVLDVSFPSGSPSQQTVAVEVH
jgi:hypothetical protein